MTDKYRPRFTSDEPMIKDGDIVQFGDHRIKIAGSVTEQNGGDEPSGDAEAVTLGTESMAVQGDYAPSPIYTREELVLTITDSWEMQQEKMSPLTRWLAEDALDALIAIGAVRVK